MRSWHLITCEFPPMIGGVSEHSRVVAQAAARRGFDVHVWSAAGAAPLAGVTVHDTLGAFDAADFAKTDSLLDGHPRPRHLLVQWVPHGYGRRGMNVAFARWIARRSRAGDAIDVMVHEPFVDFIGRSWLQPVRGLVQRHMARTALSSAQRVWSSIPGWERRLSRWSGHAGGFRVLPVTGTIPVVRDAAAVAALRRTLLDGASHLVGYFGAGGAYAEGALASTLTALHLRRSDVVFACLGRGSQEVASRVASAVPVASGRLRSTGSIELSTLSHHLQACDVMLQPYVDGVSGRRTTTVSALEHGVPVATTIGVLSEPFWRSSPAIEVVPSENAVALADAVQRLLEPERNALARSGARDMYETRFEPGRSLDPLFAE